MIRPKNLAFTACEFDECNVTDLHSDVQRNIIARDNVFKLPHEVRQSEFDKRLADALASRISNDYWQQRRAATRTRVLDFYGVLRVGSDHLDRAIDQRRGSRAAGRSEYRTQFEVRC